MCVPSSTGTFTKNHLDPISMSEATKRAIEILDVDYDKTNLPEIAKDTCGHLSTIETRGIV